MTDHLTVHVVDDDQAVRESLCALLEADGHDVEAYVSGDAFLERVDSARSGCVLLDIHMPGRSGLEVQRELRRRDVPLPVVVMTGQGDIGMAVEAMKAGASDFIEKPYSNELLLSSVRSALAEARATRSEQEKVRTAREKIGALSRRELEVMQGLLAGLPNKLVAHELGISVRTVEVYRANIMEKLEARGLSTAVRLALLAGVRPLGEKDEEEAADAELERAD